MVCSAESGLEGKGVRHVKIRDAGHIRAGAIKKLVRAAYKLSAG